MPATLDAPAPNTSLLPAERVLEPFLGLSEDEKRAKLAARMEQLRRQAPTNFRAHTQFVHRDDEGNPVVAYAHHAVIARVIQQVKQYRYVVIVAPPGYAKSTWGTLAHATWLIGKSEGRERIGLIANTDTLAWGWAGAVRETVEDEPFKAAYPGAVPDYKRGWRHNELYFTNTPQGSNPTLYAAGMNGQVQSKRFDTIILDDPTTWQQARSETQMEAQRKWVQNTLLKRFPPGKRPPDGDGRMVVVCTRWSTRDLVPMFKKIGFKVITMPALGFWDGQRDPITGDFIPGSLPLWPEKEPLEELLLQRNLDELMFELVMQGNPSVLSGDMFDPAWFQWGVPPRREEYDRFCIGVDTASGRDKAKGDYVVVATVGKHGDKVWIDDVQRGIWHSLQQEDAVLAALGLKAVGVDGWEVVDEAKWRVKPHALVVEGANEGHALYVRLLARHIPVRIIEVTPTKDKMFRASPLAARYRAGMVWHPAYPDQDGDLMPPKWLPPYEAELESFPSGPHDDQVDAVAYADAHLGMPTPRVVAVGAGS